MAELPVEGRQRHNSKSVRPKKFSTRVDLTPMVDLGFLLITFFIFTTSLSLPKAMTLIVPDDKGEPTPVKETGALTLIPYDHNKVFYYDGQFDKAAVKSATLLQLRDVIIDKKRRTASNFFLVIIKPSKESDYGDLVNVLDEMAINGVRRYTLVDISEEEERLLR